MSKYSRAAAIGLNMLADPIPGAVVGRGALLTTMRMANGFAASAAANLSLNGLFPKSGRSPSHRRRIRCSMRPSSILAARSDASGMESLS